MFCYWEYIMKVFLMGNWRRCVQKIQKYCRLFWQRFCWGSFFVGTEVRIYFLNPQDKVEAVRSRRFFFCLLLYWGGLAFFLWCLCLALRWVLGRLVASLSRVGRWVPWRWCANGQGVGLCLVAGVELCLLGILWILIGLNWCGFLRLLKLVLE